MELLIVIGSMDDGHTEILGTFPAILKKQAEERAATNEHRFDTVYIETSTLEGVAA